MKRFKYSFIVLLLFMFCYNKLYSQDYYLIHRTTNEIYEVAFSIEKINILNCEKEQIIDFNKVGYNNILSVNVDESCTKLFFSYNLVKNYVMIDMKDLNHAIDLTRDIGVGTFESGAEYKSLYHHSSRTLFLQWKYLDPNIDDGSADIDSCAIVDPTTGKNIKAFEAFFDINTATFSEDGKRLYASKIQSPEENRQGKVAILIIDSEDARIIGSLNPEDIDPDAAGVSVFNIDGYRKGVGNKLLVGARYEEGDNIKIYMYVYNMDTKQRSMKILNNIYGEYRLSSDASKIIIEEYDPVIRQYKGIIHIIKVEWSGDKKSDRIMSIDEGLKIQMSIPDKLEDRHNKTHSLITFPTNPDVILYQYQNKPFEDSYVIRLSDGKILRGPAKHE